MKNPCIRMFLTLLSFTFVSCNTSRIDPGPAIPTTGIKTNFDSTMALSTEDLQDMLQLAKACGVSRASEVSSVTMHPTAYHKYRAKSVEEVVGRKVSFVTVDIHDKKSRSRSGESGKVLKSLGRFVVGEHDVRTRTLTTFPSSRGPIRMSLSGTSLPTADKIIRAFSEGRIRYKIPKDKESVEGLNVGQASQLYSVEEGKYTLVFSTGNLRETIVYFTFDSETIVVTEIMNVIA
jgi:hypothetical protein